MQVVNRVAHVDAAKRGMSACEWEPDGPAAGEIEELWRWVAQHLGLDVLAVAA